MADVGDEVGEGIKRGMNRVLSEILREWLRKHMGKRPEPGQEHCTAPLDDPELTRAVTEALGAANIPYEVKRQSLTVGSDGQLHERATLLFDANDFDRVREVLDATLEEVKTIMTGTILTNPTDEIFVIDRAGEYTGIARRYGGSVFDFSVTSGASLNPFDTVSVSHMSAEAQVAFKTDAMLAQAGASAAEAGKKLSEIDQSIITRCVEMAFDRREDGGDPPLLGDFYEILREQPEPEARAIALRYERFVKGSMSFFNRPTNVSFDNRIIDFNLRELPDSMLVFALINVCEAVRNRMYSNYERGVRTWLYVEEIQSLFAYPTVLNYFSRFANEGRKFGLLLTGITQNAVAMLNNEAAQNIVLNADFLMLLKQSPVDRLEWSSLLNLSEQEEECIDESVEPGDGLLIAGAARIPIRGKFPDKMPDGSKNPLYALFSTNPNDE